MATRQSHGEGTIYFNGTAPTCSTKPPSSSPKSWSLPPCTPQTAGPTAPTGPGDPALAMLWPLAAVLHAGVIFGAPVGGLAGLVVVAGRLGGQLAADADAGPFLTLDSVNVPPWV